MQVHWVWRCELAIVLRSEEVLCPVLPGMSLPLGRWAFF